MMNTIILTSGLWSPPDSGSETPYSPPEDENCKQITSGLNGSLSQDSSPEMIPGNDKQHPYVPYGHPYKTHHIPLPPDVNNQMHHLHHQVNIQFSLSQSFNDRQLSFFYFNTSSATTCRSPNARYASSTSR